MKPLLYKAVVDGGGLTPNFRDVAVNIYLPIFLECPK